MNPQITSIENLIASDPGDRNVFGLVTADQLRLAALSLRLARRVGIVSGFFVPKAGAGETDGPIGAKVLGDALRQLGVEVDYITDVRNASLFRSIGLDPLEGSADYLERADPTHLVSIERVGRAADGRYRDMRGDDITAFTDPLDDLFIEARRRSITTVGIGDGGNEIGMGKVFEHAADGVPFGRRIATTVATDFCVAAGISNWGAFGLAAALSVLAGRDLLPSPAALADDFRRLVDSGGAVDGVTLRREPSTDGVPLEGTLRMLESVRRHLGAPLFTRGKILTVGVLGYGETGRCAAALLSRCGHRVLVSDLQSVTIEPGTSVAGVESGTHTAEFFAGCDLVVISPGIPATAGILQRLHIAGIPVISEMELAYQLQFLGDSAAPPLVAVTGTTGKRRTAELVEHIFRHSDRPVAIGGNRGTPLSCLSLDGDMAAAVLAVSSFQLESVVHFRPTVAAITNIEEAHQDRHRSVAEYIRIKSRVFMNQGPGDILILPYDDLRLRSLARKHQGRTLFISTHQPVDRGAWMAGDTVKINLGGVAEALGPCRSVPREPILVALLAAGVMGVAPSVLAGALSELETS